MKEYLIRNDDLHLEAYSQIGNLLQAHLVVLSPTKAERHVSTMANSLSSQIDSKVRELNKAVLLLEQLDGMTFVEHHCCPNPDTDIDAGKQSLPGLSTHLCAH